MIIDADVHISPPLDVGRRMGIEELLKEMDRSGVNKALTWLQPPYMRKIDASNEYIHQATKQHPDRILGFGWVDPHLGVEKSKDTVKRCIFEYGFPGVKLNGAQNDFYIDDAVMSMPIVEEIARAGGILALHVGADAIERTHPFRVAKIARRFPETQILVVHMGGVAVPDMCDATIEMAEGCPNLTLIGSKANAFAILKAIELLGASRVCFGSDTPFNLMHVEIARYSALLDGEVSEEDKYNVMAGNVIRLLQLTA